MKYRELMLFSLASILFIEAYRSKRKQRNDQNAKNLNILTIPHSEAEVIQEYAALKKVVFIAIQKKIYYAKDIEGQPVIWSHSVAETMAALPDRDYFQLSRGCIVHRSIIASQHADVIGHRLSISLSEPFNLKIDLPASKILAFKIWMSASPSHRG